MRWIAKLFELRFRFSSRREQYVDPLQAAYDENKIVNTFYRQNQLYQWMRARGKSVLQGHTPPEPYNEDRIQAHAHKEGVILPTMRKQANLHDARYHKDMVHPIRVVTIAANHSKPPTPQ